MPQVKRASKGKRPNKAVSVLGIAGVSLAASTGGSPADMPSALGSVDRWTGSRYSGRIRRRFRSPTSVRRKSPTSAWRRSISSTKKTSETPSQAYNSLSEEAAAADTAAAAAEAAAGCGGGSRLRRRLSAAAARLPRLQRLRRRLWRLRLWRLRGCGGCGWGWGWAAAAACHGEVAPSARRSAFRSR